MRGKATGTKSLYTIATSSNAWAFSGVNSNKLKVFGNLNFLLCDNFGDTAAPTTLAYSCYTNMFGGCTSLTQAPELPATTLATSCYENMFQNCTSLASIVLHYTGNNNPSSAFNNWVINISTTGILYKAGTQFTARGNNTYPASWTQVQI